ncbi:MAG TPA: IgGFc-binding protein, partial [Polyangiaceae bacterium]|nr:IgGFc-binding protein [Polyangiaceae bacterium]
PETLGRTYIGCDYFPTVTLNTQIAELGGFQYFHFSVAISNTSSSEAQISITQGPTTISSTTVAPDSVQVVHLPWTDLRTASATTIATKGAYRLRSTQPVTVYQFNPLEYMVSGYGSYSNDASLLIPVTAWGTRYMVASRNTWQYSGFWLPGFYSVVASEDGTTVNLVPSATGNDILPGAGLTSGQGTVVLNQGDVLQVLSGTSPSHDLTGTIVEADKPIQVIGGHACTYVPSTVPACDHLEESMFPINTLASEYIVTPPSLPTLAQPKAFFVRVIAAEPGVSATFEPAVSAPITLNNLGDYVEIDANQPFRIQATGRILVSQYMKGQNAGGNSGDPAMALAVTSSQFRQSYLFHSPVNYEHNYVNIIAPDGAQVTLDGAPVTGFVPVGTTGYSDARLKLPTSGNGNHHLEADQRVGITVYGYGQYTSYWYPGGLNLTELN